MFSKILIANRGEIACRIMRTAQAMGVRCVAVYSEADADALHVVAADEAHCIGRPPATESYLDGDKIIQVALEVGAEAIHPGYGFLSENPDFVEAVEAAGLVFIGPSADAIRAMGLKDAAKKLMEEAGVPVVPGYHGEHQDPAFLKQQAGKIGYPVLIKARAGGGGKGMRRVDNADSFNSALEGAQREGQASFGDGHVLIEKYVTSPRHIEVQVFGDQHGSVVHLFERDCSLQRRHQKVIEEAPAPGMTDEMRAAMTTAAVRAAEAIGYSGAGTIEFIVDGSDGLKPDGFWFMEMNTRLQVEHPVTEAITGVDLVEWQLLIASGDRLPLKQEELSINGHAFEARLYAEDVPKGFLPATGTLEWLEFSKDGRVDTGVRTLDRISPYYDPMIAKLISKGKDRAQALHNLNDMLVETQIAGLTTNQRFLQSLCEHEDFSQGRMDTGLIGRDIDQLTPIAHPTPELIASVSMQVLGLENNHDCNGFVGKEYTNDPFDTLTGYSHWYPRKQYIKLVREDDFFETVFQLNSSGTGWQASVAMYDGDFGDWMSTVDGLQESELIGAHRYGQAIAAFTNLGTFEFDILDPLGIDPSLVESGDAILSPMPGLVKALTGVNGKAVKEGEVVAVLEAMKMEHSLVAPRDGIIDQLHVGEGDQVEDGALLVSLISKDV